MNENFTSKVKKEILGTIAKAELRSFLSAAVHTAGTVVVASNSLSLSLKIEDEFIRSEIIQRLSQFIDVEIVQRGSVVFIMQADKLLVELGIKKDDFHIYAGVEKSLIFNDAMRTAYAKGAFIGCGSVNVKNGYHLELSFLSGEMAQDITKILAHYSIVAKALQRGKRFSLYIKNSQNVSDMLALVGAHKAVLELNLSLVDKQIAQLANRRSNCDLANIDKSVSAFFRQRDAILWLKENNEFEKLDKKLQQAAQARIDKPELSLEALAKELLLTKSGLTHRLRKLMAIYNQLKK